LESTGENEVNSTKIGEMVMDALVKLDHVAYIRFASVYRDFSEAKDFEEFLETLEKMAKPKGDN
jgi:transcriptional repressor NrdR